MGTPKGGKALEMPHEDPPALVIDVVKVVEHLNAAKERNDELQKNFEGGSAAWHACETIDDRIHDALSLLGE